MRPFGCPVTILNTIDHLGKFVGKADEGFFVGYSLNSKAFKVFNSRTRIIEENLHIRFSEIAPNVVHSLMVLQISNDDGFKPSSDNGKKVDEDSRKENECNDQEKEDNVNSTNNVNTVSSTVNVVGTNEDNELPFDPNMHALEDVSTFNFLSDDEDDGAMADMKNLDITIQLSFIPTTRIHKDHPLDQVIGDLQTSIQTRKMSKNLEEHGFIRFEDPDFPDRVYKVEKALYGLHQALGACQDKYVAEILKKYGFTKVKTASTPMETQNPLLKDEGGEEVDVYMYRSMIGSLMYLTSLRPDIMFAVCACARYQVNPKVSHLHAVKMIFRNLKGQPKIGLWYLKDSLFDLVAYTDSDYAGVGLDRKSTTRVCQFCGYRLLSWQFKKQTVVLNSTTEAEYVAALSCYGQVLWI
uniref:Retroviral polymerase SH3-like domain-containing protein n=1 Tax=Tanacetum cinerariifolium TaxID=118510 RepID=A0A699IZZ9_TANCI|nr:hypothetical protein [Tanacetum cinerariifolium]